MGLRGDGAAWIGAMADVAVGFDGGCIPADCIGDSKEGELVLQPNVATGGITTLDGRSRGLRKVDDTFLVGPAAEFCNEDVLVCVFLRNTVSNATGSAAESQPNMFF